MEYTISCPFCGHREKIILKDIIKEDDDLYEDIMEGDLGFFKCPSCGKLSPIIKNFIYLDEKRKFVILHKNDENTRVDLSGFEKEGYLIREVKNTYDLREKIILFTNNIDDRVVELMKVLYKYEIEAEIKIDWVERMYMEMDGGMIKLSIILAGGTKRSYPFNQAIYKRMKELTKRACSKIYEDERIIDYKWAIGKINNNEC